MGRPRRIDPSARSFSTDVVLAPSIRMNERFKDRTQAGRALAHALRAYAGQGALVLALPRGGVPVAFEVARALDAELDVLVARKLGAPRQPEFGFGAIAREAMFIDEATVRELGLTEEDVARVRAIEQRELARRERAYRGDAPQPQLAGRVVIVVDDGVATGGTARAALRSARAERPARLVFAAPVGPPDALDRLSTEADEVVLLSSPRGFHAVGAWYDRFEQTSDDDVVSLLARSRRERPLHAEPLARDVRIPVGAATLDATLSVPASAIGLVVFAHGSGSGRSSPRNRFVARALNERGLATLLLDLLTREEEREDERTRELRFDVGFLAERLVGAARWARGEPDLAPLPIGYFGSSTGAGAALVAETLFPGPVRAIVSRGGRPDLAGEALPRVRAATLLVVGSLDEDVLDVNEAARARMRCPAQLKVVEGATHLFEEPGALEEVAGLAGEWFALLLPAAGAAQARAPERDA